MVKLIWVCAALMAMFVTGESLTCRTCKLGVADKCLYSAVVTCSDTQPNCFWGKLALNISHIMTLQTRGCMASSLCNKTEMGALLTAGYTFTTTCCSTDCCNGATSIQLPVTTALGVTLMAVWNNCIL